jgi:hypothetical protein
VVGNNANAGTSATAPKRDLNGFNINTLPAGARVLFARGGVWTNFQVQVRNGNATPTQPLVFDAYGTGAAPWLKTSSGGIPFNFSQYQDATIDGGYTVRNLRLDGLNAGTTAVTQGNGTTHITLENLDIHNFTIGLLMGDGTRFFTLRNSIVRNNAQHGLLGAGYDWTIEGNTFDHNGDARAPGTHAIYFSAGSLIAERLTIRNNTISNSSLSGGVCRAGNVTVHGRIVGALIENNTIRTPGYGGGCRGMSIAAGYGSAEYMRQFVVRGNRFINAGGAVAFSAAPGILVENNTAWDTTTGGAGLIETVPNSSGGGDDVDTGAVVRNNVLCKSVQQGSLINVANALSILNNTIRLGGDASTGACTQ